MNCNILESEYIEPTRPYSVDEIKELRKKLYHKQRLGKMRIHHKRCDHFYSTKINSRKEKEMMEQKCSDIGNCSVCWKLGKTQGYLREKSKNMVWSYCNTFYQEPLVITYNNLDLETVFYTWLYQEK